MSFFEGITEDIEKQIEKDMTNEETIDNQDQSEQESLDPEIYFTSESLKKHVVLSKYYNESDHDDEEDAKQAKDFRGIEGWDRVDHLASALLKPERL
jgi:hypothetical protein